MRVFLFVLFVFQSLIVAAASNKQACADRTQKQNEIQLINTKLSRSEQLGMSTEKERV